MSNHVALGEQGNRFKTGIPCDEQNKTEFYPPRNTLDQRFRGILSQNFWTRKKFIGKVAAGPLNLSSGFRRKMSKEPKLCVLGVLGGKENFEAIALPWGVANVLDISFFAYTTQVFATVFTEVIASKSRN